MAAHRLILVALFVQILLFGGIAIEAGEDRDSLSRPISFDRAEPGEALSGGEATSRRTPNRNAFSHASANLPFEKRLDFKVGNGLFKKLWVSAPASTRSSDGLGPLYNARSCQRCHLKDGRGHPPAANPPQDNAVSMLMRLSVPPSNPAERRMLDAGLVASIPEPIYGGQLQDFATAGLAAEGRIHITYSEKPMTLGDGTIVSLRHPAYRIADLGYGPMHPGTMMSPRIAPPMIGLGLLEAIPARVIVAGDDPEDADGDGISGRVNWLWDRTSGTHIPGRFGWKAGQPSLRAQTAGAFSGDIGISSPLLVAPFGDCTPRQNACRDAPHGGEARHGGAEVGPELFDLVVFYSSHLAVPARRDVDDPDVLAGKRLFHEAGCPACHRPVFRTGRHDGFPELSNQVIRPYTDMLLHDMGDGLADNRPEASADGREWRTPPLWGIGLTETVNGHTFFLHDGRARSLLEAILWHGGEAESARDAVVKMDKRQRGRLLRFLNSL